MTDRLKTMAWGALGMVVVLALLAAMYVPGRWLVDRYTEFAVMRTVVVLIACGNPAEAAKLGIQCPQPQPGQGAVAPGNASPAVPVPRPPG